MLSVDAPLLSGGALVERFLALDVFLFDQQSIWRDRPFTQQHLAWEAEHRELASWLRGRSLAAAEACHAEPYQLAAPQPFPHWAQQAKWLSRLGRYPQATLQARPERMHSGIPGRKWQQIEHFAGALQAGIEQSFAVTHSWLDWCAGKGYLGRYLAWPDADLQCLEFNADLIASGQAISEKYLPHAQHQLCDVLSSASVAPLLRTDTVVALHACGDLHTHLVQQVSAQRVPRLALAPCCYNRLQTDDYQPLSALGKQSRLQLNRDDLSLPLTATLTARAGQRRLRDQSMAWRLAFDLLQRELRASDEYLPTPSLSSSWFNKPFAQWCRDLAALRGL